MPITSNFAGAYSPLLAQNALRRQAQTQQNQQPSFQASNNLSVVPGGNFIPGGQAAGPMVQTAAPPNTTTAVTPQPVTLEGVLQRLTMLREVITLLIGLVNDAITKPPTPPTPVTGLDTLTNNPDFPTLNSLLTTAKLTTPLTELEAAGPVTIYAPTEEAFAALPVGVADALQLPENQSVLQEILSYHVSASPVTLSPAGTPIDSLLADNVDEAVILGTEEQAIIVNDGQIINAGPATTVDNGSVIIPIDSVMIPPTINLDTLIAA